MITYLLASLPTPRLGDAPPVTSDAFLEACSRVLSDARSRELASAFAWPAEPGTRASPADERPPGPTAQAWAERVGHVEDAIVRARSARTGRDAEPYLRRPEGIRVDVVEAVARAFEAPDPGARERFLDALRWRLADELATTDPAGFAALFARAVQLALAERRATWGVDAGWAELEAAMRRLEGRADAPGPDEVADG